VKSHCVHGHEYTRTNTIWRKNGTYLCRFCHLQRVRSYRERNIVAIKIQQDAYRARPEVRERNNARRRTPEYRQRRNAQARERRAQKEVVPMLVP